MTKRVLHLTPAYPPSVGGIENHVATLCRALTTDTNFEPIVVAPKRNDESAAPTEPFPVYRETSIASYRKSSFAPKVVYRSFTLNYDLVHIHAPFHFGMSFGAIASHLRDIPLVITTHMYDARDSPLYTAYEQLVYDHCLKIADRVIPTTKDYVAGYSAFSRIEDKLESIPLSVDVDRYQAAAGARDQLGYPEDENIILFVGAMERHHFYKDIELLLNAFERISEADRLILAGSGDKVPKLRKEATRRGLEDSVDFPGYVPEDRLPLYYSAADTFVLPSKQDRGEAFGIVLLEAMSCGTPVVASAIPGVREVPKDGGVTYEPGNVDSMIEGIKQTLSGDFTPRSTVLQHYTTDQLRERVVDIYEEVLDQG